MALDFPNSPSIGQLYPQPPVATQPVYVWDGEKWTTIGGALGGKQNVYTDGSQPMIGQLVLVDPPVGGTSAASKNYVDTGLATVLKNTPQIFTPAQQQIARQNIYAAPLDAMMNNNLIVNGAFEVNQPAVASVTANISYFCDGWMLHMNNAGGLQVNAAQVYNPANFPGLPYFCRIQPTTAAATLAGSDGCGLYARIEGWQLARLNWGTPSAVPVTLGFWSNHTLPGLYPVAFRGASNVSYIATYTHNVSVVPQYNVITIPGCTTSTWTPDNTLALSLTFGMGYGPSLQAPAANVWSAGNYTSLANAVNACASTSNLFRITGVSLYPGSDGPSAANAPLLMRRCDQELLLCLRYYQKIPQILLSGYNVASSYVFHETYLQGIMRAPPATSFAGISYSNMSALTNNLKFINHVENYASIVATGAGYTFFDLICDSRL